MLGERAGLIRTLNGYVISAELSQAATRVNVTLSSASDLPAVPEHFGTIIAESEDAFTHLGSAGAGDVVMCAVPQGAQLARPIVIIHEIDQSDEPEMFFPRTLITVGAGASANVVELISSGDELCLVVPIVELSVADEAHLSYQGIQQLGGRTWQLASHVNEVGRKADLTVFLAALGGDYARQATTSTLLGESSSSHMFAVYFGDGYQVQDMRTFQEHAAPRTRSELVFKGAVADHARSVYSGLIHIQKGATKSDASQTNRNLVLSEGAHADSVPNLDIEENDVRCTHASAVGPIDAELRFYLESRGLPPDIADRLILLGFFEDLLARSPEAGVAHYLAGVVAERLSGRQGGRALSDAVSTL